MGVVPDPTPQELVKVAEDIDPNVVDWDGPDDPANPLNWSRSLRIGHVVLVSILTLISNISATMFAPGSSLLVTEFGITSSVVGSLTVTIYLLGFAFGPLFLAPLSELYGRLPIYYGSTLGYIAFTLGCALSRNTGMFLVFRFISGCAGSSALTIGGGTIADVMPQEKRGQAMSMFAIGPLLGPVIGPIIGGFVSQNIGWRWVFWLLTISMGLVAIPMVIIMRETFGHVLLARKAAQLRKETGNEKLRSKFDSGLSVSGTFKRSIIRPLRMLFLSPIVSLISLYMSFAFGLMFLLFTTFPAVFGEAYHFSTGVSGLSYLGLGLGLGFGLFLFSSTSDRLLKRLAKGGELKPEYRLPLMVYLSPAMPIGFFWYGWSAHAQVHWIVPIIGTSVIGIGSLAIFMPAQLYLIDAFGPYAASSLAASIVVRCVFGAFLPLAGPSLYQRLGLGWGNSVLAFIGLALMPVPVLFFRYGETIRKRWEIKM
ncbi:multidrug resistance protein [Eremomyces bilateralis CBS 781.70]|uniref:Multidrug resistance protein n=1 Tax=Eremomyces bilateralis CBS 781.70 TaxID=1392243 RepID=A0A6G1GAS8_9PEZI|nr:multidrug resistance protein [Eremomyces bilateralis CBS 781.70]KAF1815011.1 multidrug resistance protein [Eremomyces bilateralis CBS 781.70]